MSRRILLGSADPMLTERVRSVVGELGDEVVRVAATSAEVLDGLATVTPDILLVSDRLGPVPVLDLIRQATRQDPLVGVLLLAATNDPEFYRLAMEAGVRSVAPVAFTVDDLGQRIETAAAWSGIVHAHVANEARNQAYGSGHVIVFAGSKGGVGTTTLAVHTALQAVADGRRVCLVDLDLLCGDVAALLDITHRRDVVDLVPIVEEVSGQALDDALYRHPSGVHVLLAPREGERGEEVDEAVGRAVLGAVKSRFDVVVVDVGSSLTPAGAVAVQIADRATLIVTPDVASVRGARRAVQLWERLQLRRESDVGIVLNRVARSVEVQPDLAARLIRLPVAPCTVPADFRAFEQATNTGDPRRVTDREMRRALARLAIWLGARPDGQANGSVSLPSAAPVRSPVPAGATGARFGRGSRGDGGQTSVEFMGLLPIMLVVLVLLTQGVLIGYGHVLASNAAAAAARVAVSPDAGESDISAEARDQLPSLWQRGLQVRVGDRYRDPDAAVTVTVRTPAMVPLLDSMLGDGLLASATAQMRFEGR